MTEKVDYGLSLEEVLKGFGGYLIRYYDDDNQINLIIKVSNESNHYVISSNIPFKIWNDWDGI